jgi:hypothetical protein
MSCLVIVGCGSRVVDPEQRAAALETRHQGKVEAVNVDREIEIACQRLADGMLKRIARLEEQSKAQQVRRLEYANEVFQKDVKQDLQVHEAYHNEVKASLSEIREALEAHARFSESMQKRLAELEQAIVQVAKGR